MVELLALGIVALAAGADAPIPVRLDSLTLTSSEDIDALVVCTAGKDSTYQVALKKGEPKTIKALTPDCVFLSDKHASVAVLANWSTVKGP